MRYPTYYTPMMLREQVACIARYFPDIEVKLGQNIATLPEEAEGLFVIPKWERVATTYPEAVSRALYCLEQSQKVEGNIGGFASYVEETELDNLRQEDRTAEALKKISEQQKGDIIIIPAQFGMRWRRATDLVRSKYAKGEFGLGVFAVAVMLLTHPRRLQRPDDLDIICPGDILPNGHTLKFDHEFSEGVDFLPWPSALSSLRAGCATGWVV